MEGRPVSARGALLSRGNSADRFSRLGGALQAEANRAAAGAATNAGRRTAATSRRSRRHPRADICVSMLRAGSIYGKHFTVIMIVIVTKCFTTSFHGRVVQHNCISVHTASTLLSVDHSRKK